MSDYVERCRSCDAPIRWAITVNGRKMPLDHEPVWDGNVRMREGRAVIVPKDEGPPSEPRYVSHFFTCPDRDDWRKD